MNRRMCGTCSLSGAGTHPGAGVPGVLSFGQNRGETDLRASAELALDRSIAQAARVTARGLEELLLRHAASSRATGPVRPCGVLVLPPHRRPGGRVLLAEQEGRRDLEEWAAAGWKRLARRSGYASGAGRLPGRRAASFDPARVSARTDRRHAHGSGEHPLRDLRRTAGVLLPGRLRSGADDVPCDRLSRATRCPTRSISGSRCS